MLRNSTHRFKKSLILTLCALLVLVSGCSFPGLSGTGASDKTVRIASVTSTESQIIANIISELITHETDYKTSLVNNLGSSSVSQAALQRNDADVMATSYTGTDLTGTLQLPPEKNPKKATHIVNTQLKKRYGQIRYPSMGFADTYAFMVTQETAKKYQLTNVSDMQAHAKDMKVGVDSSWMNRKGDGYKEFSQAYGFDFQRVYPMQLGLVYSAVEQGKMNAVLGYSTDGRIKSYNLKVLNDDKHFFPPYDCSLVVNGKFLKAHPDLRKLLHRLDGKINLKQMQTLNYQVDNNLLEPSVAARQFLEKNNYFRGADQ
ncbi:osmoprotectant ABC transporter substrate-binding protein [Ligilactobacillus acidipiscis]|uniref:Glycine betaine carnitine choline ABC transporter substrate-binding protein n=1 Tax=Ligilactobacillus acidipiscis TaxID=89059 RepID=A0A0R2JYW4_9LACO|nr:osmoprotectant ABC transporter substrate-binding protein [Ligilactobacillus acidipiscis]KRN79690.1 glycine betaine carnitine choline ABC transporter substrate-binding protein [Ligilactobacillus acidipiscis]